jgi:hypothetical protein
MAGGTLAGPGSVTIGSNASWMAEAGTIATSLVNDGTATEPAESYFTIATGGVVTNTASATLQLADNSVIFGSCAGEAPDGGVLVNEGTLTFDPGSGESASIDGGGQCLDLQDEGPIVVASGTALVGGDATVELEGGASEIGPGLFEIGVEGAGGVPAEGALTVESGVTLGSLYIALGGSVVADDGFTVGSLVGQGTLVVSPAIDVSAGSLSLDAGSLSFAGTVELVASGGGDYGELAVDGPVDANNLTLALSFGASPPACDATIVAISAESVTGAFADVTPGAPPGDSWVAVSDPANEPTTAGAYLSCSG